VSINGAELKDRRIRELVNILADDTKVLVRQEVALAKAELRERVELVKRELEWRRELIQDELARDAEAAKEELIESTSHAAGGIAMFAAAGAVGLAVLGLLAALIVRLLEYAMPLAAAIGVTLLIFSAVTAGLALFGRRRLQDATPFVRPRTVEAIRGDLARTASAGRLTELASPPKHTIETVKEDVEWLKHPTRSETR
jgi:putative superfamily III holin-X